ncbi:MAG: response regulator [Acidiferrobacterales bacterium]
MVSDDAELEEKLRRLTLAYAQELPAKIRDISNRWAQLKSEWSQAAAEEIYREVHSLSGSSGSYGASELHLQSRKLEQYLSSLTELNLHPPAEKLSQIDAALGLTSSLASDWAKSIAESDGLQPGPTFNSVSENPAGVEAFQDSETSETKDIDRSPDFRFLYIEDNRANLNLVKQLVHVHWPNAELLMAEDPVTGLELLRTNEIQIVLLDINLPIMSGYQVLAQIRETEATKNLPVIAISAKAMPEDIKAGKEAGFDEYITKPIKIDSFFEIIDQILARKAI